MALIQCSECSSQVSDKAATCPKCGAPISDAPAARATGTPVTTTQQTSKRFKAHQLIAAALLVVGIVMMFTGPASTGSGGGAAVSSRVAIGVLLFLVGGVWYLVTRFRTWWHHG